MRGRKGGEERGSVCSRYGASCERVRRSIRCRCSGRARSRGGGACWRRAVVGRWTSGCKQCFTAALSRIPDEGHEGEAEAGRGGHSEMRGRTRGERGRGEGEGGEHARGVERGGKRGGGRGSGACRTRMVSGAGRGRRMRMVKSGVGAR